MHSETEEEEEEEEEDKSQTADGGYTQGQERCVRPLKDLRF